MNNDLKENKYIAKNITIKQIIVLFLCFIEFVIFTMLLVVFLE